MTSAPPTTNLDRVQAIYEAFGRGDIDTILAALSPAIQAINPGPEDMSYFGTRTGHEGFQDLASTIGGQLEITEFVPVRWLTSDDQVVALIRMTATVRATGKSYSQEMAEFWTFDEQGLATELKVIQDTALVAAAMRA